MNRDSISNMRLTSLYFSGGGIYVKIILACLKNNRIDVEEACQSSQCSRASGKRKSNALARWTPVGARAGSCCHSNHGGEIRAASDAVALPQWGGCSCGRTDGTSRLTVTRHKATRKGKCGGNVNSRLLYWTGRTRLEMTGFEPQSRPEGECH